MKILFVLIVTFSLILFTNSCKVSNDHFVRNDIKINTYDGSVWDYIYTQHGIYDSLILVLERCPRLRTILKDSSDVTLFGVNNSSFELAFYTLNTVRAQTNKKPLYIEDLKIDDLELLLSHYIFTNRYGTEEIMDLTDGEYIKGAISNYQMHIQYNATSATGLLEFGPQQIILSDTRDRVFHRFWVRTTTGSVNFKTSNGYIHMLNSGHDFGFNKLVKTFNY